MDAKTDYFEKDAFSRHCGIELLETGPGTATARMKLQPHHLNHVGTVHGAALFALGDAVFAAASNSHDHVAVAVNINISYLKAVAGGVLTARAAENNLQGRIGSYTIRIENEEGQLVALFEGLAYRKIK
ncbi:MAG: PaaI family thioesterase [Planctomycetaceae bacterium]|nr:PaaI family thioesterase [Planctomycetaceae bacterium]